MPSAQMLEVADFHFTSDQNFFIAIQRRTPALLAIFSIVVMLANQMQAQHPLDLPNTAWYHKSFPTFADASAKVRQQLWQFRLFQLSTRETDTVNVQERVSSQLTKRLEQLGYKVSLEPASLLSPAA